jgi:hypothetical protein
METVGGIGALESLGLLSDEALLAEVGRISRLHRVATAELVAHLAEMDARKLYLSEATPSMFVYCVRRLGFSEDEACRRIDAARIARKWPMIFARIAGGEVSLTVLGKLKPVLTDENATELLDAVSGRTVREAERILAARFPKPDVADSIRKLPDAKRAGSRPGALEKRSSTPESASIAELMNVSAGESERAAAPASGGTTCGNAGTREKDEPKRPADRGRMQPLSAERIQVKFTASRALEEKIELARDLMSHGNPQGDLATIIEAALDLLIAERLKKKLGQTKRKQKRARGAKRSHVTNQTRREVIARDGLGCTFVNDAGERCGARAFLELDHREPKGKGGGSEAENMRILCRAHNQREAERVYGKAHMERSQKRKEELRVRDRVNEEKFAVGLRNPRRNGSSEGLSHWLVSESGGY